MAAHRQGHGLRLVHSIPGRLRLKYHQVRTHPHLSHELRRKLTSIQGVRKAQVNTTTGSVLVHYESSLAHSRKFFLPLMEAFGLATVGISPREIEDWFQVPATGDSAAQELATSLREIGVDLARLDLKTVVPALLVVLGIRSFLVTEALAAPKWYEYFWFAFGIYFTLQAQERPAPRSAARVSAGP